jgi:hypothetical protein
MAFRNSVLILPDPDDFHIQGSTLGREPSPAAKRALEIYHASVFRRIEARRRRRQRDQAEPTS